MATNKKLEELVNSLTQTVSDLSSQVAKLSQPVIKVDNTVKSQMVEKGENLIQQVGPYPVPSEYQQVVETVLNKKFNIEIKPLSDRPAFEFVVSVPKEYSSAPPLYWETYKGDFRPKVVSYAEGLNGVRAWVEKVWSSFNQDTRTQISLDRAK